jgi:hypothetical protein
MTHSRWKTGLRPMDALDWKEIQEAKPQAVRETLAWVQGYILALEDVIKDLEVQRDGYLNDPDTQRALEMILEKVQESLGSAQRTLEAINEIVEEDTDE